MAGIKIGIDLGTKYTKLVILKEKGGKLIILDHKKIRTPDESIFEGEIKDVKKLAAMFREITGSYRTKGNVFLSSSMPALINRQLNLPFINKSKLDGMVKIQSEHYFSESLDAYAVQYRLSDIIYEEGIRKAVVNVFALPKKILSGFIEVLEMAGISPCVFDVHPNCVTKLLENNIISNLNSSGNIALIDFGYSMTGVHIFENGRLALTRVFPIGSRMIEELIMARFQVTKENAEEMMLESPGLDTGPGKEGAAGQTDITKAVIERLSNEILRIFRFYTLDRQAQSVDRVYIYGGYAGLRNMDQYLSGLLNCPVELPAMPENIVFKDNKNSMVFSDFLNMFGLLIRKDARHDRKELIKSV